VGNNLPISGHLKGAYVATTSSPVVEKVTRTRTVPPAELAKENTNTMPDFWEYIESLEPSQWEREDHVVYLYREDPKDSTYSTEPSYVDKFSGTIEIFPGGPSYQMNDRGIIEHAIKEKHGGKAFRLICKKGKQRIAIGKCVNGAPPKYPDTNPQRLPLPHAMPTDASVASKAIDAMANQQPDAMRLAMEVLRSASEIVMRTANPPTQTPTPPQRDPLVEALLQRALNPPAPPDPFEMFVKFKNLMGDSGGGMAGNPQLMDKVLSAAVDKILNPVAPVTGRTTLLDIGREFIPVLGTVMHEYRLSREADARITEIQRSAMPAQPAPAVPAAALPPAPAPQPVPQAAPNPPAAPALTFPQIEAHITKIITNLQYTTDEAVDKVLEFLYDTDPRIVAALLNPPSINAQLKPGKEGLLVLFQVEAELNPCLNNVPRLSEFLDKFIAQATEEEAAEARLRAAAPAPGTKPA
jgi:hypothetical protein